jgi:hypothetical protein
MVKARTEQEIAARAHELQSAAIQQANILKDKEQQLLQQQVRFFSSEISPYFPNSSFFPKFLLTIQISHSFQN